VVSRRGGTLPVGITRSKGPKDWTLTTTFDVTVTKTALTSASYTLQAILSVADAVIGWDIDAVPLDSVTAATISISDPYADAVAHTLDVTIPNKRAAGAFSNTITLTAISN
jgi:hypothetical protein